VPADRWSVPTEAGVAAAEAFADQATVEELLAGRPAGGLRTGRSPAYLAWRYGFEPLHYRVVAAGRPADGFVVFRLRRRGPAVEAAICEDLVAGADRRLTRRLVGEILRATGADYAVRVGDGSLGAGFLPIAGRGPTLVCRELGARVVPDGDSWHLGLGDVELF
jgi:hypothetical protein